MFENIMIFMVYNYCNISSVPFEYHMINFTMLDEDQKTWFNRYNQIIRGKVSYSQFFRGKVRYNQIIRDKVRYNQIIRDKVRYNQIIRGNV